TDSFEHPRDRFNVVCQDLGVGAENLGELVRLRVEVGDEQLDSGARVEVVDLPHGLRVKPSSTIIEVISGDPGDCGVPKAHGLYGLRYTTRFLSVEVRWFPGVYLTKIATTRALVTSDEEGGFPVLPTFEDVRA